MTNGGRLYTGNEVAKFLSISLRKLDLLKNDGQIAYIRIGKSVRYKPSDVMAFVEKFRRDTNV